MSGRAEGTLETSSLATDRPQPFGETRAPVEAVRDTSGEVLTPPTLEAGSAADDNLGQECPTPCFQRMCYRKDSATRLTFPKAFVPIAAR